MYKLLFFLTFTTNCFSQENEILNSNKSFLKIQNLSFDTISYLSDTLVTWKRCRNPKIDALKSFNQATNNTTWKKKINPIYNDVILKNDSMKSKKYKLKKSSLNN